MIFYAMYGYGIHKGPLHMSSVFCQEWLLFAALVVLLVARFPVSQAKCSV